MRTQDSGFDEFVNFYAVLGRFLLSLNKYCLEEYGLEYEISHYREYDFAKVSRARQEAVLLTPRHRGSLAMSQAQLLLCRSGVAHWMRRTTESTNSSSHTILL